MIDLWDGLALVGVVLVGIGLWMVSPSLSLTVVGVILIALALFLASAGVRRARANRDDG